MQRSRGYYRSRVEGKTLKIKGQVIEGPNIETVFIPRGDTQIVFHAKAILDYSDFEAMCPAPNPPNKMVPGGATIPDLEHPKYKEAMDAYGTRRFAWMILKSLEATEGLEWETVDMSDPETWANYEQEFKSSGFSDIEANRILKGIMAANCLDEDKVEQARQRFLVLEQEAALVASSPQVEPASIESGESAND